MTCTTKIPHVLLALLALSPAGFAQESRAVGKTDGCVECHADPERWGEQDKRFHILPAQFGNDIHWQRGLRCQDCHGGDPAADEYGSAHKKESGFRSIKQRADVPEFCGRCHSDAEYMRRFRPSPRIDQLAEYRTSGHGKRLLQDGNADVATCVSCHGGHGVRKVDDLASPVYPTHVADTCAKCHSDAKHMQGFERNGKPIAVGQRELWRGSVHGLAMNSRGDVSAPTCNDCHGNHGAVPPEVGSVANACGSCHGKIADLFRQTRMKHQFEEVGLPGCATCHSYHDIRKPSDEMLGMGPGTVCSKCHADGKFGAPVSGAAVAKGLRDRIENLKRDVDDATHKLDVAERLGMEVRASRFELVGARNALTNARSLVHTFATAPVESVIVEGQGVAAKVKDAAQAAMVEHGARRVWLWWSVALIAGLIAILLVCIRRIGLPVEHAA